MVTKRGFTGVYPLFKKVEITQDRFDALWNYKKNHWEDKMIAEIEHEGLFPDGTPKNGIVVAVREV